MRAARARRMWRRWMRWVRECPRLLLQARARFVNGGDRSRFRHDGRSSLRWCSWISGGDLRRDRGSFNGRVRRLRACDPCDPSDRSSLRFEAMRRLFRLLHRLGFWRGQFRCNRRRRSGRDRFCGKNGSRKRRLRRGLASDRSNRRGLRFKTGRTLFRLLLVRHDFGRFHFGSDRRGGGQVRRRSGAARVGPARPVLRVSREVSQRRQPVVSLLRR